MGFDHVDLLERGDDQQLQPEPGEEAECVAGGGLRPRPNASSMTTNRKAFERALFQSSLNW